MSYEPIGIVVCDGGTLVESSDLSIPLSSLIGKNSFLVLEKNLTKYVIDISKIILLESEIDLEDSVETAFSDRTNDIFVIKYLREDIPLLNKEGVYSNRLRVFNAISYKDFKVQFTSVDTPEIVDDVTKKGFLDDLVISSRFDMTNYLVSVNGVFHKTVIHEGKLYVLDGFRTMRISDYKDVTVVDTTRLGGHSIVDLNEDNVTFTTYNGIATIDAGQSLKNKTVFFVIDGYFYHLDCNVYYHADDSHLKLMVNKLPLISQFRHNPRTLQWLDRYGEGASQSSRKYDDDYADLFLNNKTVPTTTLTTKEFQYSRLTHYHSFMVIVDNPSLFSLSTVLLPTGTPQFYTDTAVKVSSGMMSYGEGLCPSYLILRDPHGRKSIFIQKQDYDLDLQKETLNPRFIPGLISDPQLGSDIFCRFVDYVSN